LAHPTVNFINALAQGINEVIRGGAPSAVISPAGVSVGQLLYKNE